MVWLIRLAASLYVVTNALNMLGQWRYANVPVRDGGSRLNPFNDPKLVPSIYGLNNGGEKPLPHPSYHGAVQWPWVAWTLLNVLATVCFAYDQWGDKTADNNWGLVVGTILTIAVYVMRPPLHR